MKDSIDFGSMEIPKLFRKLLIPTVLGMVFSAVFVITDGIFVGRGIGSDALAAVNITAPLFLISTGVGLMFGVGASVVASIHLAQGKVKAARINVTQAVAVSSLLLAAYSFLLTSCAREVALLLGSSERLLPLAVEYMHWFAPFLPFSALLSSGMFFIRLDGSPNYAMLCNAVPAVINIVLDPLLIFGLGMGVKGAAIATVLSQAVGAIWVIRFLTGPKTILKIRKEDMKLEGKIILPVLALGISTFVMLSTESLLSISFSSSLARYGGDVAVGAMTVITSASQLCTMPISGICQGGQPVMSFNFGAGKKDRVKQAFRFQLTLCLSYTTIFWLLMMLVPGAVAGIFTSDASLIDYTTWAMRIYMAGIFSTGVQIACQQSFMALGQAKVSLLLACLRKLILLIPLIFILPHVVANPVFGVFLAAPVSDIIAATVTATTFFLQFNKILDKGAGRV